mmetsp:Transcript_120935/g.349426  ORF Transcript_120935/g.349426 Transcript_120935/m.349426 type:complete len:207 (+) Transcript_120935:708-1328(+)
MDHGGLRVEELPQAGLYSMGELHRGLARDEVVEQLEQGVLALRERGLRRVGLAHLQHLHRHAAEEPEDTGVALGVEVRLGELVRRLQHHSHPALMNHRHAQHALRHSPADGVGMRVMPRVFGDVRRRDDLLADAGRHRQAGPGEVRIPALGDREVVGVRLFTNPNASPEHLPQMVNHPQLRVRAPQQLGELFRETLEGVQVLSKVN